jgi:hypothetical protein
MTCPLRRHHQENQARRRLINSLRETSFMFAKYLTGAEAEAPAYSLRVPPKREARNDRGCQAMIGLASKNFGLYFFSARPLYVVVG